MSLPASSRNAWSRSGHRDAYVEMVLTRGVSPTFSRDPRDAVNQLICFAIPFGWILKPEDRESRAFAGRSPISAASRRNRSIPR